jgi:hypothetical protein
MIGGKEPIPNVVQLLKHHLVGLLTQREPRTQLATLRIIEKLLQHPKLEAQLDDQTLAGLIEPLGGQYPEHPELECRIQAYGVMMSIWDSRQGLRTNPALKLALLRGLTDSDDSVRQQCKHFWNRPSRLSDKSTARRLEQLLAVLYAPEVEAQWLSFAPALLLEMCTTNINYEKEIFDHDLDDCKFSDVCIFTSTAGSSLRSLPMTPLFTQHSARSTLTGSPTGDESEQVEYESLSDFIGSHPPAKAKASLRAGVRSVAPVPYFTASVDTMQSLITEPKGKLDVLFRPPKDIVGQRALAPGATTGATDDILPYGVHRVKRPPASAINLENAKVSMRLSLSLS